MPSSSKKFHLLSLSGITKITTFGIFAKYSSTFCPYFACATINGQDCKYLGEKLFVGGLKLIFIFQPTERGLCVVKVARALEVEIGLYGNFLLQPCHFFIPKSVWAWTYLCSICS